MESNSTTLRLIADEGRTPWNTLYNNYLASVQLIQRIETMCLEKYRNPLTLYDKHDTIIKT